MKVHSSELNYVKCDKRKGIDEIPFFCYVEYSSVRANLFSKDSKFLIYQFFQTHI